LTVHEISSFEGYEEGFYGPLNDFEENSFWFDHRMEIILSAYHKYFEFSKNFLEIGCGTGFVLSRLRSFYPDKQFSGADILPRGLIEARKRCPNVTFFQIDARNMPFVDEFDVIGAFDVIEHIDEDEHFLSQLYQAVKPGGGILLTAPQYAWLWTEEDRLMHHVRRYYKRDLIQKLFKSGFTLLSSSSIFGLVFPAMVFKRKILRYFSKKQISLEKSLRISIRLNCIFRSLCRFELYMHKKGITPFFGGSLLVAARKEL
jgi:SAM-dependent methyltransferase